MINIGRLCLKICGRDAGKISVVVDTAEKDQVLIDGQVRRRKCNIKHLEPLDKEIKIKKGASHAEIVKELKKINIIVKETKPRKKKAEKPTIKRTIKRKKKLEEKKIKKEQKKAKKEAKKTKKDKNKDAK